MFKSRARFCTLIDTPGNRGTEVDGLDPPMCQALFPSRAEVGMKIGTGYEATCSLPAASSGIEVSLVCSVVKQWHVVRVTVAIYSQHTFQFVTLTVSDSSSLFTRRVLQNVTIAMVTMGTVYMMAIVVRSSVQAIIVLLFMNLATTCNVYSVSCCMYMLCITQIGQWQVKYKLQIVQRACAVTISMLKTHYPNSPLSLSCACIEIVHNMLLHTIAYNRNMSAKFA